MRYLDFVALICNTWRENVLVSLFFLLKLLMSKEFFHNHALCYETYLVVELL